jgi:hypothetical protein
MQRSERDAVLGAKQLYENLLDGANNCAIRRCIRPALVKIFCGDEENTVLEAVSVPISEFRISHGLLCKVTKLRTLL